VPENFGADAFVSKLTEPFDAERAKDAFYFILNRLVSQNDIVGYQLISKYCEPAEVNKEILKNIFGNNYSKYVAILQAYGAIVEHSKARIGVKSATYFLGAKYRFEKWAFKAYSPETTKKILKYNIKKFETDKGKYRDYAHLIYWFTTKKLAIDAEGVRNYIRQLEQHFVHRMEVTERFTMLEAIRKAQTLRKEMIEYTIRKITKSDYNLKIDHNGRLYSVITNMPEPLRHFLRYDGQDLVAIDVKNSQPFHFCYLFNPSFWAAQQTKCSLRALLPKLYDEFSHTGQLQDIRSFIKEAAQEDDVKQFLLQTEDGSFYDKLVEMYCIRFKRLSSREGAKKEFLAYLNFDISKKNRPYYSPYREIEKGFRNVIALMEKIKLNDHVDMSRILQSLEAKMILRYVGRAFSKKYPDVPIFTVHDNIITLKDKQEELQTILYEQYAAILKMKPTIKPTLLNENEAFSKISRYVDKKCANKTALLMQNIAPEKWQLKTVQEN